MLQQDDLVAQCAGDVLAVSIVVCRPIRVVLDQLDPGVEWFLTLDPDLDLLLVRVACAAGFGDKVWFGHGGVSRAENGEADQYSAVRISVYPLGDFRAVFESVWECSRNVASRIR